MKSTQLYDFTLVANGSQVILADANFYKILTSTGDLRITRDGGTSVRPMRAGRGEREVDFQRLTITDISGAPNSGTILVGDSNFIDDTIVLSSAINVRPEPISGSYNVSGALVANTAVQVVAPGTNTAGLILTSATFSELSSASGWQGALIAKSSAPANISDGDVLLAANIVWNLSTSNGGMNDLKIPQHVAAGNGLYFICSQPTTAASNRTARWKLL